MRQNEFREAIGFFEKWHTGNDEYVDPSAAIIVDPRKYLLCATDDRGTRTVTHKPDTRPEVRRDFELAQIGRFASAVKRRHPLLAD